MAERTGDLVKDLLIERKLFDQRKVAELARRLDNIDGQADTNTGLLVSNKSQADVSYITASAESSLAYERTLVATSPVTATDNGPNATLAIGMPAATNTTDGYATSTQIKALERLSAWASTAVNLTLTASHYQITVTASGVRITLPAAATCLGRDYVINASVDNVLVDAAGSELINGDLTMILSRNDTMQIVSTGTGWFIK